MKILKLIIITIFGINSVAFSQENIKNIKITNIDSTEHYYFFKGKIKKSDNRQVLIISKRDSSIDNCNKIKLKAKYNFVLENYLPDSVINEIPAKPKGTIKIREEGRIIWDGRTDFPYKSINIISRCYIKPT